MNIVSTVVGLSIMGTAMPMVANMAIQPMIAQKRAENLGIAEASAVTYAAMNEGLPATSPVPDGCVLVGLEDSNSSYSITCVHGKDTMKASVTRSFRLAIIEGGEETGFVKPKEYTPGVYCPLWDPWGVQEYNLAHNVQCIPVPYGPFAAAYPADGEILWEQY